MVGEPRKIWVEVSLDGQELIVHMPITPVFEQGAEGLMRATSLTTDERRVLKGLMDGLTDKEIANELHMSIQTVKHKGCDIRKKLGIRTRNELRGRFDPRDVKRLVYGG